MKTASTRSKKVQNLDTLFDETRKVVRTRRIACARRFATLQKKRERTEEVADADLERLIDQATAAMRRVVRNSRKIQATLTQALGTGHATVFRLGSGRFAPESGLLISGNSDHGIALSVERDKRGSSPFDLMFARMIPRSKRARATRAKLAERISVIPIQVGYEPGFSRVWREVRDPSAALARQLARLTKPEEAVRALALACA